MHGRSGFYRGARPPGCRAIFLLRGRSEQVDGFSLVKRLCHTGRIFFCRLLRLLKAPHKVFGILGRSRIRERIAGDEGRIWLGGISAQVVPAPGGCLPVPHGFVDASFRGVPFRSAEGVKVSRCPWLGLAVGFMRGLFQDMSASAIMSGDAHASAHETAGQ